MANKKINQNKSFHSSSYGLSDMYCFLVPCILIVSVLSAHLVISQKLQSTIKITKAVNCNITGLKMLLDEMPTYYHYPKTYINARFRTTEDIKRPNRLTMHIERCNDRGYNCEDFMNWRIGNLCKMMTWKNQIWSEFMDHSRPRMRCPLRKMIYEVHNSSLDVDAIMNWFPDMFKYRWKLLSKVIGDQDDILHCSWIEVHVQQFRM